MDDYCFTTTKQYVTCEVYIKLEHIGPSPNNSTSSPTSSSTYGSGRLQQEGIGEILDGGPTYGTLGAGAPKLEANLNIILVKQPNAR